MQSLVLDTVIPYQAALLEDQVAGAEKSHAIENYRVAAGAARGGFGAGGALPPPRGGSALS